MNKAKRNAARKSRRNLKLTAFIAAALVLVFAVAGTVAWLVDDTEAIPNTFTAPKTDTELVDVVSGDAKTKVGIKNTADYPVYARIAVVGNKINEAGNVIGGYSVSSFLGANGWFEGSDGYYYWPSPIAVGGETGNLLKSSIPLKDSSTGEVYQVTVMSETIQAEPITAVADAWDVTVNGSTISKSK